MYRRIVFSILTISLFFSISMTSAWAKGGLSDEISEMWNADQEMPAQYQQKITSFFIKTSEHHPAKFTMLIAFNGHLTQTVRQITKSKVTPLICSVASLPLETAEFRLEALEFRQGKLVWSPQTNDSTWDAFPLGQNTAFGGMIEDSQVHQGVILLPARFDINKPIDVIYQGASKQMLLTYK